VHCKVGWGWLGRALSCIIRWGEAGGGVVLQGGVRKVGACIVVVTHLNRGPAYPA
jgi:hypothetical protein